MLPQERILTLNRIDLRAVIRRDKYTVSYGPYEEVYDIGGMHFMMHYALRVHTKRYMRHAYYDALCSTSHYALLEKFQKQPDFPSKVQFPAHPETSPELTKYYS